MTDSTICRAGSLSMCITTPATSRWGVSFLGFKFRFAHAAAWVASHISATTIHLINVVEITCV
jgi:hypothetical protein